MSLLLRKALKGNYEQMKFLVDEQTNDTSRVDIV